AGLIALGAAACGSNDGAKSDSSDKATSSQSDKSSQSQQSDSSGQQGVQGTVADGKTVAKVNGTAIKGVDYNGMLKSLQAQAKQQSAAQGQQAGKLQGPQLKQMKKQAIDALVGNELVLQDADK